MKKRYALIDARKKKGLNQSQLGKALGQWAQSQLGKTLGDVPRDTIATWEDGSCEPRADMIPVILGFFGCTDLHDLDLHASFNAPTHCREEIIEMLRNLNRRDFMAVCSALGALPEFAGIDMSALNAVFSGTLIAPDNLLSLCGTVINQCWLMLDQGSFSFADVLLTECVTKLDGLATKVSPFQLQAASLATEVTILQMIIAAHTMNFVRRASLGESAVKFGGMADDNNTLIMALGWHGDTFTNCFHQPGRAIDILRKAVPLFDNNSPLNQADISISLANAYALDGNTTKSRDYLDMAHTAMPEHPELDPLYRIIGRGQAELDGSEGNMYLELAKRFPTNKEYPQLAYDALTRAVNQPHAHSHFAGRRLILKAEGAKAIGEKDDYLDSLTHGVQIALQVNSQKQISKAVTILQKTPSSWRTEQKYIELCKILAPNSMIVTTK